MNLCLLKRGGGMENYCHHLKSGRWFSSPCSAGIGQCLTSPTRLSAQTRDLGSIMAFALSSSSSACVSVLVRTLQRNKANRRYRYTR